MGELFGPDCLVEYTNYGDFLGRGGFPAHNLECLRILRERPALSTKQEAQLASLVKREPFYNLRMFAMGRIEYASVLTLPMFTSAHLVQLEYARAGRLLGTAAELEFANASVAAGLKRHGTR